MGPAPTSARLAAEHASETVMACQTSLTYSPCEAPKDTPANTPSEPNTTVRRHAQGQLNTVYF